MCSNLDKVGFGTRFDGLCKYGIAVIVIEDHKVLVAAAGGDGKTASLVSRSFPGDVNWLQVHKIGLDAWFIV